MLQIITIPSGTDNYIWLIKKANRAIVIDPGEASAVNQILEQQQLQLHAILITHYHHDHIDGISELLATHANVLCYGPETQTTLPFPVTVVSLDQPLALPEASLEFTVMPLPGHTPEHIGYYGHGVLFCGDTLFAGGCGRVLGGTIEELYASLQRIKALPRKH